MRANPKVSILMSVYNGSLDLLKESVESVLRQTLQDFEFIIIDDKSSGVIQEFVASLSDKDERIKVLRNKENIGLTKSLNRGLALCRGDFVARLDSDDIAVKDRLEVQTSFLDGHEDYVFVSGYDQTKKNLVPLSDEEIRKVLVRGNPFIHSALTFRRSALEAVNGYDESFRYAQDFDLVSRLLNNGKAKIEDKVFVKRNIDRNTISFRRGKEQLRLSLKVRLRYLKVGECSFYDCALFCKSILRLLIPNNVYSAIKTRNLKA